MLEAAGPSPVAISAISANMDSFSRSRTATLKKQPSHMEAAHFGDLGKCLSVFVNLQQDEGFEHGVRNARQEIPNRVIGWGFGRRV